MARVPMSIQDRHSYLPRMRERYLAAKRRERSVLLDEIVARVRQDEYRLPRR